MIGTSKAPFPLAIAWRAIRWHCGFAAFLAIVALPLRADLPEARDSLRTGNYTSAIRQATSALANPSEGSPTEWALVLVQGLLAVGRNADADTAMREAINRDQRSIRLKWLARDVAYANGRPEEATQRHQEVTRALRSAAWLYRQPADLVIFGRAWLTDGWDPKEVLEKVFSVAQRTDPKLRDVYLARGELALAKHDFALAAKAYEEGLKVLSDDPDLLSGHARAYDNSNREIALASLEAARKINPRHTPTLLQYIDHHIDAENYEEAEKVIDEILAYNKVQPDAWAYRSVIAHLKNDPIQERIARERALASWPSNPRVDYLIGEKLSAKYRFAEGAAAQRRALAFDPEYLPATAELATNLLRLGETEEGWKLAQIVHEKDDYDVEAYNLVTLKETMSKYVTLADEDFVIRMASSEVAVYGPRVQALLRRAKAALVDKYGVQLAKPTYIEIFADQRDFAVRTFGLPDVAGFLGVCFGRVVTANSPATSSSATNWESVLWHEFCHVVTLQMTKNKMPRWLSEGISVYEEWQADPSWGMRIDSKYREMLLGDDLVPVSRLSAAFLAPKTPRHLQFAYLESALVVEYIISKFGIDKVRGVLTDLRNGIEINTALAKNTVEMAELERGFKDYAHERAKALAPGINWEKPDPDLLLPEGALELASWERTHVDNYYVLLQKAQRAAERSDWAAAKVPLQRLVDLYPQQKGPTTAYRSLVAAHKALGDEAAERRTLLAWVEVDDEATDAFLRLMEIGAAEKDWKLVARNAERYLAVNPLVPVPYRYLADASLALGDNSSAVVALRTLIQLDVPERTDAHYRLAELLHRRGDLAGARRHVLMALEETPRYREALQLLLELQHGAAESSLPTAQPVVAPTPTPKLLE